MELAALKEEINLKSKSSQLTRYDLEMMELSYELILKRQALENAQNAKKTVRLTRDASGNMIYQYTADQDKVMEAQQAYNDVLYQMNQKTEEEYKRLGNALLKYEGELADALDELMRDENLSAEERQRRYEEIMDHYAPIIQATADQMGIVQQNMLTNQEVWVREFGLNIQKNTGETNDQITKLMDHITNSTNTFLTTVENNYITRYTQATEIMSQQTQAVTDTIKANYTDMEKEMQNFSQQAGLTKSAVSDLNKTIGDSLANIRTQTQLWSSNYAALMQIVSAYEQISAAILATIQAQQTAATTPTMPTPSAPSNTLSSSPTTHPTSSSGTGNGGTGNGGTGNGGRTGGSTGTGTGTAATQNEYLTLHAVAYCTTGKHKGEWTGGSPTISPNYVKKGGKASLNHNPMNGFAKGGYAKTSTAYYTISGTTLTANKGGEAEIIFQYWDRSSSYAEGGLVNYTGPAWVDGSPDKPEYVLNPDQTRAMAAVLNKEKVSTLLFQFHQILLRLKLVIQ